MLTALENFDLVDRKLRRTDNVSKGKSIGLAPNIYKQRGYDGESQRQLQLKAGAATELGGNAHHAPHLLDHVLDNVQSNTTP